MGTAEDLPRLLAKGRALHERLLAQTAEGEQPVARRIIVISLERQTLRRERFLEQLRRFPSLCDRVEWYPAVDGSSLRLEEARGLVSPEGIEDALTPRDKVLGYVLTRGAIGLVLSLHRALTLIASEPDESCLFLLCEDDAIMAPDFPRRLAEFRAAVEEHDPMWEILHVGYNPMCTTVQPYCHTACSAASGSSCSGICQVGVPTELFGMYSLALLPRGARALLHRLFPVSLQVDTELSRLYRNLRKENGSTLQRVTSTEPELREPRLRVYAPVAESGPLVVAPGSRADCTDIQVLSGENFSQQYKP